MPPPQRQQRTLSVKEKKLNDRVAKLAQDAQRADGTSISNTDVSQWIAPPISWSYQNMIVIAVTRFKDFIKLVGPDDSRIRIKDPEMYFCSGAQHMSLELVRLFLLYLARTSSGKLDERITSKTARGYISHTLCAAYRFSGKKQLTAEEMSQVYVYINKLERDGELSNKTRVKPVATKNDLDVLIAMVFSDAFALKLSGVRLILNLALYMNLYVDSCGRGSDLAWGGPAVVEQPNHCLCWDHCDFYVVRFDDGDRVIAANINLKYQKGQTTSDEQKTITLRLLPTAMATQDSLRLLVTLGLVDGVFGPGMTWADLIAVEPSAHSRKIRQSDAFVGVPVFRSALGQPLRSAKLGENITGLGRLAGFEHRATPYSLRRGYANVLYANVSAEDRRFLMGHKTNSDIYSHYHSAISVVSVQEIFRGIRAGNAAEMHGLSLNRTQKLPQTISEEGWLRVQQDPEIVKAGLESSQVKSELCELYGSISAAVRACDPRIESLVAATARLKNRRRALMGTVYQEEYRMAFAGQHPRQSTTHDLEFESMSTNATLADAHDWMLEVTQDEEAVRSLDDYDIIGAADSHGQDGDHDASDGDPSAIDNEFEANRGSLTSSSHHLSEGSEAIRLHNINDGSAIPKNMSIARFRMAVSSGGYTDAALSDLMVEVFSAAHKSGKFIPGEEPLLGTYTCRFSGADLSSNYHAPEAAHAAHAKKVNKIAKEAFESHLLPIESPCSYYAQGPLKLVSPKLCGYSSFKTRRDQIKHVFQHTLVLHQKYYAAGNIPRGEWHCYYDGCAILTTSNTQDPPKIILSTRSIFSSERDYLRHVYYRHRLSPLSVESISWCGICEQFLEWEQFGARKDDHFASHWEEVWGLVREHGYVGQFDNGRRTVPSFCPFCLHNENLSPTGRISATMSQVTRDSDSDHIAAHIDAPNFPSTCMCPCFPITCTYQQEMLPQELSSHLSNVHGIAMPKTTRKEQRETQKKARALGERSVNAQGGLGTGKPLKRMKK